MPFTISMALFALGLYLLIKKRKSAKRVLMSSFILLFVISYPLIVDTLLDRLEMTYPTLKHAPKDIRYIYLLGGGHHSDNSKPITSQISPISVIRLTEAIRLHQEIPNSKIILSGYSGINDSTPHALMEYKLATALGVDKDSLIIESSPRDTKEEAQVAKKIVGEDAFILVSSASHLKRAMIYFKKAGLNPIPAPTNHLAYKNPPVWEFFSTTALYKSTIVAHEYLGLLWQKLR